jgi:hypothetical protein
MIFGAETAPIQDDHNDLIFEHIRSVPSYSLIQVVCKTCSSNSSPELQAHRSTDDLPALSLRPLAYLSLLTSGLIGRSNWTPLKGVKRLAEICGQSCSEDGSWVALLDLDSRPQSDVRYLKPPGFSSADGSWWTKALRCSRHWVAIIYSKVQSTLRQFEV